MRFVYRNIQFQKHPKKNWVIVRGDIHNDSGKGYNSVAFRMVIFIKGMQVVSTNITVHNFGAGKNRSFEKSIEGLDYKLIESIVRYEINPEGAY